MALIAMFSSAHEMRCNVLYSSICLDVDNSENSIRPDCSAVLSIETPTTIVGHRAALLPVVDIDFPLRYDAVFVAIGDPVLRKCQSIEAKCVRIVFTR